MGFAILGVVLYHSRLFIPHNLMYYVMCMGFCGVDICLFASGVGCYFSLSHNSDAGAFFLRRLKRLYPTYFCFILIWVLCQRMEGEVLFPAVVGNLMAVQYFTGLGNEFNWYISAVFLFYLLAPYLFKVVKCLDRVKWQVAFFLLVSFATIPFWDSDVYIIAAARLPVFVMGMLWGKFCQKNTYICKQTVWKTAVMLFSGIVIFVIFCIIARNRLWSYGLAWYPLALVVPGLCLMISYGSQWLEQKEWGPWVIEGMNKIGECSFEVYLIHILVLDMLAHWINMGKVYANRLWLLMGAWVIVGIGCVSLRYIVRKMRICWHLFANK